MDGHADSLNHEARGKTSGLHGATALPAVLPKRGDSSQGAQVTFDRFVPWVVGENDGASIEPIRFDRSSSSRPGHADRRWIRGIRWLHSVFDATTTLVWDPTRAA